MEKGEDSQPRRALPVCLPFSLCGPVLLLRIITINDKALGVVLLGIL